MKSNYVWSGIWLPKCSSFLLQIWFSYAAGGSPWSQFMLKNMEHIFCSLGIRFSMLQILVIHVGWIWAVWGVRFSITDCKFTYEMSATSLEPDERITLGPSMLRRAVAKPAQSANLQEMLSDWVVVADVRIWDEYEESRRPYCRRWLEIYSGRRCQY